MKQLTFEICCKYPNAKYLHPCDRNPFEFRGFKHSTDDTQAIKEKFFVVLYGDWSGGTNPQYSTTSHTYISDCKLVLTPLTKISDEDAIEVAKIYDKNCEYKIHNKTVQITDYKVIIPRAVGVERYVNGHYMGYEPLASFRDGYNIEQIDYLRSRGYNCDPYELVFGENCIDKITLNQTV